MGRKHSCPLRSEMYGGMPTGGGYKAYNETIPIDIRLAAVGTYMVLIELAEAMERSVTGWRWPAHISSAFRDRHLIAAVRTLRERVEVLYPEVF